MLILITKIETLAFVIAIRLSNYYEQVIKVQGKNDIGFLISVINKYVHIQTAGLINFITRFYFKNLISYASHEYRYKNDQKKTQF